VSDIAARPGPVHEGRVRTLEALATLAGFLTEVTGLPDGRRPDVVRICTRRQGLFLGEAKAGEGPKDQEAVARLARYVAWWQRARRRGPALLVVCCGRRDGRRWAAALTALAAELGDPAKAYTELLSDAEEVAWLASWPDGQMSIKAQSEQRGLRA
jgi:hypothetical protein